MEILQQIGINHTALFQFVIFTITLIFLSNVVFKPYAKALEQREQKTKGGEDLAVELQKQAAELQKDYEVKVKDLTEKMKNIFETHKSSAQKDSEVLVTAARKQAEQTVEENRKVISTAVSQASNDLKAQTPQVAMMITQKLIGK
ncbi:MAG: ATP synthase F0 subunit B [Bdellovibrionia bacterium]